MAAPTLDDVKAYLGPASDQWADDVLIACLAAEQNAQEARCRVPALFSDDLREALLRRVQRNLALRELPVGLTDASGDSGNRAYVPGSDPEIRRLEAPYRRLVVG